MPSASPRVVQAVRVPCCYPHQRLPSVHLAAPSTQLEVLAFTIKAVNDMRAMVRMLSGVTLGTTWAKRLGQHVAGNDWTTDEYEAATRGYAVPDDMVCHHLIARGGGYTTVQINAVWTDNPPPHVTEFQERVGWAMLRELVASKVVVVSPSRSYKLGRVDKLKLEALDRWADDRVLKLWAARP